MNAFLEIFLWATYLCALYFAVFWLLSFLDRKELFKKEEERSTELKDYPEISVIIPAYNAEHTIQKCIQSVIELDYPREKLELIVINDGSEDSTEEKIKELIMENKELHMSEKLGFSEHPEKSSGFLGSQKSKIFEDAQKSQGISDIKLISQENKGKAAALNNALKTAKGELFACLDSDSFVDKATLKKMVHVFMENGDDLKIVIPALKVSKPKNLLQKLQHVEYMISMFLNRILSHLDSNYVAPGPFSLYRKQTVIETGGFDENNLTEDQEIAYRMQSKQHDIIHCHDAYVSTIAPENLKGLSRQRNRWYKGGLINLIKYRKIMLNKEYGHFGMFQLPLLFYLSIGAIATVIFFNYFITWPIIKTLYDLYLVGFDIMPYLKSFHPSLDLLSMDIAKGLAAFSIFLFTLIIVLFSIRNAKEKISLKTLAYLIPYFMVYYVIMSFIAVLSLAELLIGKTQKW